jgi:hypothetical protein
MPGTKWLPKEVELLRRVGLSATTVHDWRALQKKHFPGRSAEALRIYFNRTVRVPVSPYPKYNDPLVMSQDALVLNDLEAPFHHADFVGNCLALAASWGVKGLVLGGDFLHNDALSGFEPAFVDDEARIAPELADLLLAAAPKSKELAELVERHRGEKGEPDHSEEMERAKTVLLAIGYQFDEIHCILGNHEGRLLRAIQTPLNPNHVLKEVGIVDNPKWKIRPYYFCHVVSGGETFRVTHPKNTAKASAWKLAAKFHQHVLMAHNHQVVLQFDPSGKFYAIETGCCVDESRLPYASQRDNAQHAHKLGAVLIRNGHPWLLHEGSPWDDLLAIP